MKKMIITICFLSLGLLVYAAVSDDTPSSSSKTEIIKNDTQACCPTQKTESI